eukprot:CAMPEP_0184859068 /NCGR_PEP_ID=MMETSP0580-20130426/4101_1 /TAXON_ID=1118495 /ORGANISM="Dactyliosolen fragilissimus" /LENGTH=417 /DNA_ID=CAMNT_0027355511 /DNA_START=102 /DNA_END=1352 /DNA_ORIENTATION=+
MGNNQSSKGNLPVSSATDRPNTIVIENKVPTSSPKIIPGIGASSAMGCMSPKLVICLLVVLFLSASGILGWLIPKAFQLPGLNKEVDRLENQVGNLKVQIDELSVQNDLLKSENDRLDESIDELGVLNGELSTEVDTFNKTVSDFREENVKLNNSNAIFQSQVEELEKQRIELEGANNDLNIELNRLDVQVGNLQQTNTELSSTLTEAQEHNEDLNQNITLLQSQVSSLEGTKADLEGELTTLETQNEALSQSLDNLSEISDFLEQNQLALNETYTELENTILNLIAENRKILLENSKTLMDTNLDLFPMSFRNRFSSRDWIKDDLLPIGTEAYEETDGVRDYLDENLFTELCIDEDDFNNYVAHDDFKTYYAGTGPNPPSDINTKQLELAVFLYGELILKYYFPDVGEPGLTVQDW